MRNAKFVDNLKLRLSYGVQGNDYLFTPNGSRAYTPYTDLYGISSTGTESVYGPVYKGTKDITWEKNHNLDLGLEFSLWRGKIAGELDFFKRKTQDMLFNLPIPSTTGFTSEPVNLGSMENTGFEFSLTSNVYNSKTWNINLGVNGTTYKNEITSLPEKFRKDGIAKGNRLLKEGGGIFDYYMVKSAGVDPKTGDALYYCWDKKEKKFKAVKSDFYSAGQEDKQYVGTAIPDLIGGFYANASAYGFDFSIQCAYRLGGLFYDGLYAQLMTGGTPGSNWHKDILKRWTPNNVNTNVPRVEDGKQAINNASDRFVIDGSYLALNNVTVGYTLPRTLLNKMNIQSIRLYLAADNVALWSKRKGMDPRTSLSGSNSSNVNSPLRAVSFGVNLTL